jgi:hypothetical protein
MSYEGNIFKPEHSVESNDVQIEVMMALEAEFARRLRAFEDTYENSETIYGPGGNETDRARAQKAFDIYQEIINEAEDAGDVLTARMARKVQELETNRMILCDGRAVLFKNKEQN